MTITWPIFCQAIYTYNNITTENDESVEKILHRIIMVDLLHSICLHIFRGYFIVPLDIVFPLSFIPFFFLFFILLHRQRHALSKHFKVSFINNQNTQRMIRLYYCLPSSELLQGVFGQEPNLREHQYPKWQDSFLHFVQVPLHNTRALVLQLVHHSFNNR